VSPERADRIGSLALAGDTLRAADCAGPLAGYPAN
jgi:hypothetical protein